MKKISNQFGFAIPILILGGFIVLFVTISLIKVGTLEKIEPDLSRIGIGPTSSPANLAQEETTTNLSQVVENPESGEEEVDEIFTASSVIDADSDIEAEGDNPAYIE